MVWSGQGQGNDANASVGVPNTAMLGQAQGLNKNFAKLNEIIQAAFSPMSVHTGTFTLAAAATTTVSDSTVKATSIILFMPVTAAAGTVMGSAKSLYVSARTAGTSFVVATADGSSPSGTCTFAYLIVNTG